MLALAACLALPASTLLASSPAATPDVSAKTAIDQFLQAGSSLTGVKVDDRDLALSYLGLLRAKYKEAQLAAFLAANSSAKSAAEIDKQATSEIERHAMLLWLNGSSIDPASGKPKIFSYTGAAVWGALPFTKPPGQCGGAFGYWADPPAASS
ncbi:hypothetical protein BH11PSE11_BH11PSE11_21360 [soil metagenome]